MERIITEAFACHVVQCRRTKGCSKAQLSQSAGFIFYAAAAAADPTPAIVLINKTCEQCRCVSPRKNLACLSLLLLIRKREKKEHCYDGNGKPIDGKFREQQHT
jgi:hypothetical protein